MIEWWVELIFLSSCAISFIRIIYQTSSSKIAGRSITDTTYWILTIAGSILLGIYGLLIGSIAMPASAIIVIIFGLYHINLEKNRKKKITKPKITTIEALYKQLGKR